jgi:outer membrane biosynthesis protein TonB
LSPGFAFVICLAAAIHVAVGVAVAYMQPAEKGTGEGKDEEVFAVVEMKTPEVEKPPEEPVEPQPVKKDTLSMSEKAPAVSDNMVRRVRERSKTTTTTSTVSSLLNVLSKGSGKAGASDSLKDLVSNIDAVKSGGAGSSFSIAGAIASLPGEGVNIARSGGGGVVSTLSGDQVAGKGTGIGTLGKSNRKGKVRGKVTKMSSGARVGGSLSRADVLRVINANLGQVQACYERALMSDPSLSGRIAFDWTVSTSGKVKGVRVRSSTLGSAKVASCISARIKRWKFPRPKGGEATITYPFLFRAVN